MREQVSQNKKANTSVSIPTLKQPTRGFGLESLNIVPQATPEVETANEPLTHDISKISLRPQAKLSISQPGDFYEQQADSIAQQVMRRMAQPVNRHSLQRQEISEEKEDTNLQMKPLVNFVTPLVQRQQMPEEEELQMKSVYNSHLAWLQRQQMPEEEAQDEEPVQMKLMVQCLRGTGGIAATSDLETSIKQSRGRGQPLADDIKQPMEQAFGADFGSVRVHTDGNSDKLNKSIQARAFTTGQDIFFRQGEYSPGSSTGKELLAHELTHVIQQNGNSVQRKSLNSEAKLNKLYRKSTDNGQTLPLGESPQTITQQMEGDNQNQTDEVENSENSEQQNQATTENQQTTSTPPAGGGNGIAELPPKDEDDKKVESGKSTALNREKQPDIKDNNANSLKTSSQAQDQPQGRLPEEITRQDNVQLLSKNVNNITTKATGSVTGNGEKAPASPEADPEFQAVINNTKQVAVKQKEHPPANTEAQEAQDAAQPPGNEVESKAQANQVGEMGQAETSGFDAGALKVKLMERIADMAPKNLKEADEFKNGNKLDSVKGDLSGQVKEEKKESQGDLEQKTKAKPDTSGIETKKVTPLTANNPGTAPVNIGADKAAPKSKGQGEIEAPLQQESQNLDQQMANANVTEEQLAKSNQPEFQAALTAKKEAQTETVQGPAKYRQEEQGIIANAKATAEATAQQHLQGMHGIRNQNLGQVGEQQVGTKGKDEQARAKVAGDINKIYEGTKTKVETILNDLDGKVIEAFDNGAAKAKKAFEDYVGKRMDDYKKERYSGFWGPGKWLVDQFLGLPSEVNVFYTEGRELYIKEMDGAINKVVTIISKGLTQAKVEISKGKQEIQNYIKKLPQDLQSVGQEAAAAIESKFAELEQSVENKQNELIDTLAQKYQENLQAVDARIDEMKAANKGLIQKALDAVVGVVKTIIELTKMLIEVLARAASVVGQIIKDPIGFLSNLVSAVKQGFLNFMKNIGTHLQNGLISWLTGTMAEAGIELPEKFDLKGIFSFVMQLLGFTYEAIRAQAVKRLGEENVSRMEQTVEVFQILATEGVAGIWQFIQEKIGDLNSLVIEPIKNFVIEKVITAGIEWVLSLLTPASAFIQAAKKIYEIVKFFIENAQRIADLINAILDSIVAIASGSLDQAIKGVENALAKSLPVVISFLASLLGLDGIAGKIQAIFQKLRKPMETAVNWVIDKGKKAFGKVSNKFNNSKVGKKFNAAKDAAVEKYKAGKQWVEDKKAAGEKWFDDKKQALLDATEKRKAQFANTKAGKALNSANDGLGKKLDALDKKRQAFNNKIEAAKEWPSKQLEKVQDKAAELRGKAGEKIKNSKFGKSVGKTLDKTKDVVGKKKDALGNKLGFGKDKEKDQDSKEAQKDKQNTNKNPNSASDKKPVEIPFAMNGEQHTLFLTLGKKPSLEMASKRDRLSNKIGRAIAKLQAQPSKTADQIKQIEALKQIGKTAKLIQIDQVKKQTPELQNKIEEQSTKLTITLSNYAIKYGVNDIEQILAITGDDKKGLLAAYRGIHFKATWDEQKYENEVKKQANAIIGQPEFSQATYEVAKNLLGKDTFTVEELESAAETVRQQVEQLKQVKANELKDNPKQEIQQGTSLEDLRSNAQQQAYHRLKNKGIEEPTQEQLNQEIEAILMKPIQRGSNKKATLKGFENMFYVSIHQYVNDKKQFLQELSNLKNGRYTGLKFTKIPFISTSKVAQEAAKYAFGKAQDQKDVREEGVVGRIFIYLFSIKEEVKQGTLNIEKLHKENKISRREWNKGEAEVTFTGSIPGENLVGYHNADISQTPEVLGSQAEQTAKDKAANMGGLYQWDT